VKEYRYRELHSRQHHNIHIHNALLVCFWLYQQGYFPAIPFKKYLKNADLHGIGFSVFS